MSVENLLGTAVPCFKPSKGNPAKVLKSYSLVYAASGDKDIVWNGIVSTLYVYWCPFTTFIRPTTSTTHLPGTTQGFRPWTTTDFLHCFLQKKRLDFCVYWFVDYTSERLTGSGPWWPVTVRSYLLCAACAAGNVVVWVNSTRSPLLLQRQVMRLPGGCHCFLVLSPNTDDCSLTLTREQSFPETVVQVN
jgi:hypothetical protein